MAKTGPRPWTWGERPHLWKTGPDPVQHEKYRAFIQQRNQAQWRGETWHLSFDQWLDLWGDQYHLRGRQRDTLCLTRKDYSRPWSTDNCEIISRQEHNERQFQNGRRPRRSREQIESDRKRGLVRKNGQRMPS